MGLGALIWLSIILMPTLNALTGSFTTTTTPSSSWRQFA
jgi:hypothetical protein